MSAKGSVDVSLGSLKHLPSSQINTKIQLVRGARRVTCASGSGLVYSFGPCGRLLFVNVVHSSENCSEPYDLKMGIGQLL